MIVRPRALATTAAGPRAATALPPFVYVMAFTAGHLSEARNTIASLRRAEGVAGSASPSRVLVYSDLPEPASRQLRELWGAETLPLDIPQVDVRNDVASHGSVAFSRIVVGKFSALGDALRRHPDAHLVWMDTDLYFFRDPRPALLAFAAAAPASAFNCQPSGPANVCTGFFHLPPGGRARTAQRTLLYLAQRRLTTHLRSGAAGYKGDEACINEELRARRHPHARLPAALFPTGRDFFDRRLARPETAVLVHNNFIRGLEKKIARFKAHGYWLPEADAEPAAEAGAEAVPEAGAEAVPEAGAEAVPEAVPEPAGGAQETSEGAAAEAEGEGGRA
jgi:hypothetical protein